jgi:hypothetical protein
VCPLNLTELVDGLGELASWCGGVRRASWWRRQQWHCRMRRHQRRCCHCAIEYAGLAERSSRRWPAPSENVFAVRYRRHRQAVPQVVLNARVVTPCKNRVGRHRALVPALVPEVQRQVKMASVAGLGGKQLWHLDLISADPSARHTRVKINTHDVLNHFEAIHARSTEAAPCGVEAEQEQLNRRQRGANVVRLVIRVHEILHVHQQVSISDEGTDAPEAGQPMEWNGGANNKPATFEQHAGHLTQRELKQAVGRGERQREL